MFFLLEQLALYHFILICKAGDRFDFLCCSRLVRYRRAHAADILCQLKQPGHCEANHSIHV